MLQILVVLFLLLCQSCFASELRQPGASSSSSVQVETDGTVVEGQGEDNIADTGPPQHCVAWGGSQCDWEPNLRKMNVDFGPSLQETFYAYVQPDVSTFYNKTTDDNVKAIEPNFSGFYAKFINMSPDDVVVYYESGTNGDEPVFIADIQPFSSSGTATWDGDNFFACPKGKGCPSKRLIEWEVSKAKSSLYYYDPYKANTREAMKHLQGTDIQLYQMQLQNRVFAEQYKKFTNGVEWLALYKQKKPPRWHMWRADSFGQTYEIETREIHFVEQPHDEEIKRGMSLYGPRPDEVQRMRKFRDTHPTLNLTMKVLSCAPRVFEVPNFLSDVEIKHILDIASKTDLHRSTVAADATGEGRAESDVRTSTNSWIPRFTDAMIDALYKRAADVLQMNESLLRARRKSEIPEFYESHMSVAERLQLVHYEVGQEYTPHHDFTMPGLVNQQPSRFATLLIYLNDVEEGGETSFPSWLNAETTEPLKVKPERGKAVLFYNLLPDGNYDGRSQHAALPVKKGEKWLINLWIWDPVLDHTVTDHY